MKIILVLMMIVSLVGCARTMTIPEERFSGGRADLALDASELKGYISIPLINYKVVNVTLSDFPECVDGEAQVTKSQEIGNATLTPDKHTQSVEIPSGIKMLVSTNSDENAGGNTFTCWNSVHFTPGAGEKYILKITPHESFGSKGCSTVLLQYVDGERVPVESAVYPKSEYKGFWRGREFDHCDADV
jgi:uncharacterized protein YceK